VERVLSNHWDNSRDAILKSVDTMLNKTDPICFEQSLFGFMNMLGIFNIDLYTNKILKLAKRGKLRYTDKIKVEAVLQSIDGQYMATALYNSQAKLEFAHNYRIFFTDRGKIVGTEEFASMVDFYNKLDSDKYKRLNLRQHKTTLNVYAKSIPNKIKDNLGCRSPKTGFRIP